jgi:transcriptional regulator with XRE-family HTH domain
MEETVKAIASNLRRLRTARGLSAAALARESGVARATLAELENGRGNPTVETLYGLARVLGVTFADLLVQADAPPVHVVRAGEGPQIPGAVVQARLLRQASVERTRVEMYDMRVVPGEVRHADAHQPGVVEQLLVHSGRLRVGPEAGPVELGPGDFAVFEAAVPHLYEALDGPVAATLVILTPA